MGVKWGLVRVGSKEMQKRPEEAARFFLRTGRVFLQASGDNAVSRVESAA